MNEICPYCSGKMEPGSLCASQSAGLSFEAHKYDCSFSIRGPYLIRRYIMINASYCKACSVIISHCQEDK